MTSVMPRLAMVVPTVVSLTEMPIISPSVKREFISGRPHSVSVAQKCASICSGCGFSVMLENSMLSIWVTVRVSPMRETSCPDRRTPRNRGRRADGASRVLVSIWAPITTSLKLPFNHVIRQVLAIRTMPPSTREGGQTCTRTLPMTKFLPAPPCAKLGLLVRRFLAWAANGLRTRTHGRKGRARSPAPIFIPALPASVRAEAIADCDDRAAGRFFHSERAPGPSRTRFRAGPTMRRAPWCVALAAMTNRTFQPGRCFSTRPLLTDAEPAPNA